MIRHGVALVAASFALGDCRMCKKDPPPVLFPGFEAGATGRAEDAGASADAAASEDGGLVPRTAAERAAGDGRRIVVDGVTVTAPEGAAFREFLALDVDGDGDRDLVATVVRQSGRAGVLFFSRDEAAFVPGASPNTEAPSDACVPAGLASFGARTWALRYEQCAGVATGDGGVDLASVGPNTALTEHVALAVDGAGVTAKLRVSELGPRLPHTGLSLDLVYADRDGDGRSDLAVHVGASREGESVEARATVVLLDRGMGFARDTSEPAGSIARLLAQARALGANRRRAADALALIERAQRLRRALCVEAGAPRVRVGGEFGVRCGGAFNGFAEASARALLAMGELPAAEAAQWPDTASEFGVVDGERFDQDLQRAAGSETGVSARQGPFVGTSLEDWLLRGSALTLEPAGAPTHVALRGPVHGRVDLATFASAPTEDGALPELQLRSPDGARVAVGAWQTCEGVMVAFCAASDPSCVGGQPAASAPPTGATLVRLQELPSQEFGARCLRREASSEPVRRGTELRPVGWAREGLVLAWRGRLYRASGDGAPFVAMNGGSVGTGFSAGSAASADGRLVALQGADAVYVRDATGRWRGWRPPQLAGRTRQLSDLVVSDAGRLIAGRVGTQLWVIERM